MKRQSPAPTAGNLCDPRTGSLDAMTRSGFGLTC